MMKKVIKGFALFIVLILSVTMIFCGCNQENGGHNMHEEKIKEKTLETYIVKNGVSPYKIVIQENPSEDILMAVSEFQYFFKLCTDAEITYIYDTQIENCKGKYFSIGNTAISIDANIDTSYEKLKTDGYALKTYGDSFIMVGNTDKASLYAVYGYLKKQFNLEIYSKDIYTYDKKRTAKLVDYEGVDVPDISIRTGGTYLNNDSIARNRYRMRATGEFYECWGHSFFTILNPSVYYGEHPEYYNKTISTSTSLPTQLALENEEMWDAFVNSLKEYISGANETSMYFNIGLEDNYMELYHNEEEYDKKFGKYGKEYRDSVAIVLFVKYVTQKVTSWVKEVYPNRNIIFSFFAYQQTVEPPVKWNGAKNSYEPLDSELILPENVAVFLAPIRANNFSHSYWDETNMDSKRQFEGWSALVSKMIVWGYSTDFANFVVPCNSWGSIKENYMHYKDAGVMYLYEQGMVSYYVPNYMELRQYLVSKLSWDVSLNEEELIKNFMYAYYGAGGESMYEYFTVMRTYLTTLESQGKYATAKYGAGDPSYSMYFTDKTLFPKIFLDRLESLTDKAIELVEAENDEVSKQAIIKDRMPVRYMILSMYKEDYDIEEYLSMAYEFRDVAKKCGFAYNTEQYWDDTRLVDNIVDNWINN